MRKLLTLSLLAILLGMVLLTGCQRFSSDSAPTATEPSAEEAEITDSLDELNELDQMEKDLDINFEEMEGLVEE